MVAINEGASTADCASSHDLQGSNLIAARLTVNVPQDRQVTPRSGLPDRPAVLRRSRRSLRWMLPE